MTDFNIVSNWLGKASSSNELEATQCGLKIEIENSIVSYFTSDSEISSEIIHMPAYYFAEWIAENWWALLWEPVKNEEPKKSEDAEFLSRHSIIFSEHGFPLPQLKIVSNGPCLNASAISRKVSYSDIQFPNRASAYLKRELVEGQLRKFVDGALNKLNEANINETYLNRLWSAVTTTLPEAVPYCEMIGSLGLSPYADNNEVDKIIDLFCRDVGETFTRDLCLVATPQELGQTARKAKMAISALSSSQESNLTCISGIHAPKENLQTQAWYRGKRAASIIRDHLSVSPLDKDGANLVFEKLNVDPSSRASIPDNILQVEDGAVVGAVRRTGNFVRIANLQKYQEQRRFTAARGIFSAWVSGDQSGHLLTQAVTRHQQASRAFAAELIAPLEYIKKWVRRAKISSDDIKEIAQNLCAAPDVVYKQAVNNGLAIPW
jgi:hypothetical protein